MIKQGNSYDAEELAKLCGFDIGNVRYETYVFEGEKAKVIAQDEGNGVVKVLEIIRQIPICPACGKEIKVIYTSRSLHLKHVDDKWVEEQDDHYFIYTCGECSEELSDEELEALGVPEVIR